MITGIIVAAVVVGCVGIILGFFLGIAGEKFKVETDPREDAILEVLPGNNCGGCGYAGCSGLAAAIAKGEAPVNQCPVRWRAGCRKGWRDHGCFCGASVKKVAFVKCAGTCEKAKQDYEYHRSGRLCGNGICSKWRTKVLQLWMSGIWKLCESMSV